MNFSVCHNLGNPGEEPYKQKVFRRKGKIAGCFLKQVVKRIFSGHF